MEQRETNILQWIQFDMDENITHLLNETKRMIERIDMIDEDDLNELLELRDDVISKLSSISPLSLDEKEMLQEIRQYDNAIIGRMEFLKEEASQGLAKLKASQMQKNMYEQLSPSESYFIDRKE
ncbi:hypothetical protein [Paenibacillus sp. L3-i20]|uniref:hypothetical protein n=1 Tax=Paenibacillus sp. L3-i20 TaxID=2905833 RepID=UPI001EE0D63F|nr:hypothetical protein [Paenibacillus sp. L3-i20]GKU76814.1 hypothetical protein L3i20_v212110 [Paenibacillus sp. L3-i20]